MRTNIGVCGGANHPHHRCVCLSPPAMRFPRRALDRYPFIWVSLSPSISFPAPFSAGLAGGGQAHMGGKREELTLQRGSWKHCTKTTATKDRREMEGGRTWRGDIWCSRP